MVMTDTAPYAHAALTAALPAYYYYRISSGAISIYVLLSCAASTALIMAEE